MKKLFIKSLIVSLSIWQAVFTSALPIVAYAQETEATPSPESTTIETGDATSSATAQGTANTSETEVTGSLTGDGCGVETTCEGNTLVSTEQEATTDTISSADSGTGENEATTSGDLIIDTGDAGASAVSDSEDNINVVSLVSQEPESSPSPSPEAIESSLSPSPSATLEVDTEQEATSSAISGALSETGENMGLSEEELQIITGAAYAIANTLNIANVNLVGSDLVWLITTILGSQEGTINFYELFQNLPQRQIGDIPQETTITTDQTSNFESQTQAGADTGNNIGEGQTTELETGNAIAVANTINLTNLNLVGSSGLFTVINIVGSLLGDIILPNGSHLLPSGFPWGNTEVITNQEADIDSSSSADGNTGENVLDGSGEITTGNATAISNTQSFANLVRIGDGWALLIFNLFGNWNGSLLNWQGPGSEETLGYGTHTLEQEWDGSLPQNS